MWVVVVVERIVAVRCWCSRTVAVVQSNSAGHYKGQLSLSLDWAAGMTSAGYLVEFLKNFDQR